MSVRVRLRRTTTMLVAATMLLALGSAEFVARAGGPRALGPGELVWWDEFRQQKLVELMQLISSDGPRLGGGELAPAFATPKPVPGNSQQLGFSWPVGSSAAITSFFGYRRDPLSPGVAQFHHGLDIRCNMGSPIVSPHRGEVLGSGTSAVYGNWLLVGHEYGFQTFYGHLSGIRAARGEQVARGETIAWCGSTGRSTGPHLHFEVRHAQGAYDPLAFLPR